VESEQSKDFAEARHGFGDEWGQGFWCDIGCLQASASNCDNHIQLCRIDPLAKYVSNIRKVVDQPALLDNSVTGSCERVTSNGAAPIRR
jgi:hypothetical protein